MARDPSLTVIHGTLDVLILKALALGPQHGYGISAWLRLRTDGDLDVEDGAAGSMPSGACRTTTRAPASTD